LDGIANLSLYGVERKKTASLDHADRIAGGPAGVAISSL